MASHIGRRKFLATLGGAVAAWPLAVHAQQPTIPVVGFLRSTSAAGSEQLIAAFRQELKEAGFVEGQDVAIDFRWGETISPIGFQGWRPISCAARRPSSSLMFLQRGLPWPQPRRYRLCS